MRGVLFLGGAVFASLALGGTVGLSVLGAVSDKPVNSPDGRLTDIATGAVWAGRVGVFFGTYWLVSKL